LSELGRLGLFVLMVVGVVLALFVLVMVMGSIPINGEIP
jgi:hypothetical protein